MGITYGDHLIDSGYYDITPEQEREVEERKGTEMTKIYFSIDQTPEGHLQLSINDENGGYRIFGPKYDGRSKTIRKHEISERDVSEIGQYLSAVSGAE